MTILIFISSIEEILPTLATLYTSLQIPSSSVISSLSLAHLSFPSTLPTTWRSLGNCGITLHYAPPPLSVWRAWRWAPALLTEEMDDKGSALHFLNSKKWTMTDGTYTLSFSMGMGRSSALHFLNGGVHHGSPALSTLPVVLWISP